MKIIILTIFLALSFHVHAGNVVSIESVNGIQDKSQEYTLNVCNEIGECIIFDLYKFMGYKHFEGNDAVIAETNIVTVNFQSKSATYTSLPNIDNHTFWLSKKERNEIKATAKKRIKKIFVKKGYKIKEEGNYFILNK